MSSPNRKFFSNLIAAMTSVFLQLGAVNAQVQRRRDLPVTGTAISFARTDSVPGVTTHIAFARARELLKKLKP